MKSEQMPAPISLAKIVRLALPIGTKIRPANAESRGREVRWAVVVGVPMRRDVMVEQGDTVATEFTWAATHTGPLVMLDGTELPPTGKRIEAKGMGVTT